MAGSWGAVDRRRPAVLLLEALRSGSVEFRCHCLMACQNDFSSHTAAGKNDQRPPTAAFGKL